MRAARAGAYHGAMAVMGRAFNALVREAQRARARLGRSAVPPPLTFAQVKLVEQVFAWIRDYLDCPHARLGRGGAVCPFAQPALESGELGVVVVEAGRAGRTAVRGELLRQAAVFEARLRAGPASMYASVVVVFRELADGSLLDEFHDELKTGLMEQGIMAAAMHPGSEKPGVWNAAFPALRAPFAAFALRRMDVRDIVFVGSNLRAFSVYRRRFGELYARGAVSDEHGYVQAFAAAQRRFNLT